MGRTALRIKSASEFGVRAQDRGRTLEGFQDALTSACASHPGVRSHSIEVSDGSLTISIEVEAESWASAESTVLEVIESAVLAVHGTIISAPHEPDDDETAIFEQLGTHLVPA